MSLLAVKRKMCRVAPVFTFLPHFESSHSQVIMRAELITDSEEEREEQEEFDYRNLKLRRIARRRDSAQGKCLRDSHRSDDEFSKLAM